MRPEIQKAVNAVKLILHNIMESDFAEHYGVNSAYALREYKADLVVDILKECFGISLESDELETIQSADWTIEGVMI